MSSLILLIASLLFKCILSQENEDHTIINLDSKTSGLDLSTISSFTKDYWNNHKAEYKVNLSRVARTVAQNVENDSLNFLFLKEVYAVFINTLQFYRDESKLEPGKDYKVFTNIDSAIIPNDYYKGVQGDGTSKASVMCSYTNQAPNAQMQIKSDFKLKSLVNSNWFTFGINKDTGDIEIIQTSSSFSMSNTQLGSYVDVTQLALPKFINLFLPDPAFYEGIILCGIGENKAIYLFEISESTRDGLKMTYFGNIDLSAIVTETTEITSVSFSKDYVFISTSSKGLLQYSRPNSSDASKVYEPVAWENTDENLNWLDLIVNKNTVYVIVKSKGMFIYDFIEKKWLDLSFAHTRFAKFDYLYYSYSQKNSTYFVGLVVDNDQPSIPEVLIEVIASGEYEYEPKVNRIYTTSKNLLITDIATDKYSYFSYFFDRTNLDLYILTRSVPYFQDAFNYWYNWQRKIPSSGTGSTSDDYLFLVSERTGTNTPYLAINEGNDKLIMVGNISRETQTWGCLFEKLGKYTEWLVSSEDCSTTDESGKFELKGCETTYTFLFNVVNKRNWIWIWIGIVVVILIIIGIITAVIFCKRKPKPQPPTTNMKEWDGRDYIQRPTKDDQTDKDHQEKPEVLEYNIDNKLDY